MVFITTLCGRWFYYPPFTSEALICYVQDAHVKLDSCFTLTLITVKVDVCTHYMGVRKRGHTHPPMSMCTHMPRHLYTHTINTFFWSMLLIRCWKDLCLGLVNRLTCFRCRNSSTVAHLSFPLGLIGQIKAFSVSPALLAGYRSGCPLPFPTPFLQKPEYMERQGAPSPTVMGRNWVLSLF